MPQKGESGRDLIQIGRDNVKNFLEVNFHSKNKKISSELEYYLEHWHQFDGEQQVDIFNSSFNKYCKRMNKLESFDNNFWWLTFVIVFLILGMLQESVLVPLIERSLIWRKTFGTVETILNTTFTDYFLSLPDPKYRNSGLELDNAVMGLKIMFYFVPSLSLICILKKIMRIPLARKVNGARKTAKIYLNHLNSSQKNIVKESFKYYEDTARNRFDDLIKYDDHL